MPIWRSSVVVAISEFTKRRELQDLVPAFRSERRSHTRSIGWRLRAVSEDIQLQRAGSFCISVRQPHKNIERVAQDASDIRCKMEIVGNLNVQQKSALAGMRPSTTPNCSGLSDAEMIEKYRKTISWNSAPRMKDLGCPS